MVGWGTDKVRSAHFSIAIGRALGTPVVVTVHGELDGPGARHLGSVLADIIDGQGNLAVVVDLHDTIASDTSGLSVLVAASERASRHGGVLSLSDPPRRALPGAGADGPGPVRPPHPPRRHVCVPLGHYPRDLRPPGSAVHPPAITPRVLQRLRTPVADPLDALTRQERKILDLITEGMTNRQIGEALFLAEKTVKNYVSHLLAKLGMGRRTEAAALAATLAERRRANP